ncbi:MAG: peptidylprolyl isomerase [Candidatus Marinimicrobia bacterium]|nr:peptidylprolyl isomerase [Candidatus Neomarinimicrobiota bacterium]
MQHLTIVLIGLLMMNSCAKEEEVVVVSTRFGDMVLEFYPDVAPKHVESFKIHAQNGYFDGTTFHRVIPGFVIQGGDPNSRDDDKMNDGQGGHAAKYFGHGDESVTASWTLPAEFNDRPHVTGALSMARAQEDNSAGSQFFICSAPVHRLNNKYTVFGQVISGLEVIQNIVNSPRDSRDNPKEKVEMTVSLMPRSTALEQ